MKTLLLLVQILAVTRLGGCSLCPSVESLNITEGLVHPNGSILLYGIEFITGTWYEVEESNQTVRYGCPCIGRTCMFKCCPAGQEYFNSLCVDSNSSNTFSPQLYKEQQLSALKAEDTFFYLHGRACDDNYLAVSGVEELYIQEVRICICFHLTYIKQIYRNQFIQFVPCNYITKVSRRGTL